MKSSIPVFRTGWNYDRDAASAESGLVCEDPSRAQQSGRDEADINTIVKRFNLTGELPTGLRVPAYGDFTEVTDYQSALNLVMAAEDSFMRLPADIRARFGNDPAAFLAFCDDPRNADEVAAFGVVKTAPGGSGDGPEDLSAPEATPPAKPV